MARFGFMIGLLVSASLGLLLLLQVIASIQVDVVSGPSVPRLKTNNPILQQASRADDDSVFLLGAGKADITGYVSHPFSERE